VFAEVAKNMHLVWSLFIEMKGDMRHIWERKEQTHRDNANRGRSHC
jgi:hypothetical protein